jgi:ribonuclease-3
MTERPVRPELETLQQEIGYRFADADLLRRALTHASANEATGKDAGLSTYQRLEFLGDRVLGLVIADMLVEEYPSAPEGELSRRLARLVSGETCARVGRELALDRYMIVDGNVLKSGSKAATGLHGDICESIIGALYRDGGLEAARGFIEAQWNDRVRSMTGPLRDAKTELQEWAHRREFPTPRYEEISRKGPDHAPTFQVDVVIEGIEGARASGGSKREAEHKAAEAVLRREGIWGDK